MGKEKFFHQLYPPGQSDGLGGRVVFFFLFFLRKKLACRLGHWKINLDEGEKEMYVQVRIRYSSIEEGLHGGRECE